MAFKKWVLLKEDKELSSILSEELGISQFASSILVNRGHSDYEEAVSFLTPDDYFASPFDMQDMKKAVERILTAVDSYESIFIYGDYDCDGITSTAALYTYLNSMGADVHYYIPERNGEGYGLNCAALDKIKETGGSLVITVDNGITAVNEVEYGKTIGLDFVITDHHQPGDVIPGAAAVVNPHRRDCPCQFKDFAGVGVVFKLIAGLEDGDCSTALEYFADIFALGTIADVVPLVDENRTLVKYGLEAMKMTDNMGILALMEVAGVDQEKLDSRTVAFSLVPRINASGRMGSASLAVKLLLTEDYEEALKLANELNEYNNLRRSDEGAILEEIEEELKKDKNALNRRVIIEKGENWNHGILGIVAARLVERYGKPVMLMCRDGEYLKGSARSVGEFHIFKALSSSSEFLTQYGGHKLAGGFSLEADNFESFREAVESYAEKVFDIMPVAELTLDKRVQAGELTLDNIKSLSVLEPFGAKNESPLFLLTGAILESIFPLSENRHLKLSLNFGGIRVQALYFGMSKERFPYTAGQALDIAAQIDVSSYNGRESLSVKVRDIRPAGFNQDKFLNAKAYYEKIRRGEEVLPKIMAISVPAREETGVVYKYLKQKGGYDNDIDFLYIELLKHNINYCKLRLILDILDELNLISVSPALNKIELKEVKGKVDLNSSKILTSLHKEG